jgi:NitT/TauT family transport system ATP-binding protein
MSIIEVRNIVKTFSSGQRSVTAIENISFSVDAGKFATVVGPSGCGKSTLLMMIGGLTKPTSGEVKVNGETLVNPRPDLIGMVFQDATLLPWKTAFGNVEFPLQLDGVNIQKRQSRVQELLGLVGLKNFTGHFPHELSGGMRQRVGIARGLAHDPTILLMDEPFSALDEQSRTKMGQELLRIWEITRKTVLFITHSLTEAVYLSDVIFVMSASPGRIVETIEVDITRPRPIDVIDTPEFGRIRNRIWHLISAAEP